MVAVEWERKKGAKLCISNKELVYFDGNHLDRYNSKQRDQVLKIIERVNK